MTLQKKFMENEKKQLVLERLKTLNQESKLRLGGSKEISVKDLIRHVEKEDEMGQHIVQVQIKMLQVLAGGI